MSSYHFTRSMRSVRLMPSVAGWLDAYLSPDTALGSWAEHLQSYWRVRDRPNVLFLTYEQMRADLPGTVDKIAALMGVALTAERARGGHRAVDVRAHEDDRPQVRRARVRRGRPARGR